jgi:acetaldehyde dehydrogenase (acetylating)
MAATMAEVMDALGVALDTIDGLRVYDFPPNSAQPPFAFVDLPDAIEYDLSMGRGNDRATYPVVVAVAAVVDRAARDAIAVYAAGSGAQSVKAVIDAAAVGSSRRVESVQFRPVTLASGTYAAAIFNVDVVH